MATPYLQEGFKTKRIGSNLLEVTDRNGKFQMLYNLESLAVRLLNNERVDRADKAAAAAAIVHLLALT